MPCAGLSGVDYIDQVAERFFTSKTRGTEVRPSPHAALLKAFVEEDNIWCPKWVRENYMVRNQRVGKDEEEEPGAPAVRPDDPAAPPANP